MSWPISMYFDDFRIRGGGQYAIDFVPPHFLKEHEKQCDKEHEKAILCARKEATSFVKDCIARCDFATVLRNQDHFWQAFCLNFDEKQSDMFFRIDLTQGFVDVTGTTHFVDNIKSAVEDVRKIACKAFDENRNIDIVFVEITSDVHIREATKVVDLNDWLYNKSKIYANWFGKYIKDTVVSVFKQLGADATIVDTTHMCDMRNVLGVKEEHCKKLSIKWDRKTHGVYLIPPLPVTENAEDQLRQGLYEMYSNGKFCDFSLIHRDQIVKIHKIVMHARSGPVIQAMIDSGMLESSNMQMEMNEFSLCTVHAFVKYMYLGCNAIDSESVDPYDLLAFAHMYQLPVLMNHAINIINLTATAQNKSTIKKLAKKYGNDQLRKLVQHIK